MNTLIIITGATASGKTAVAIEVARRLGCDIIGADSRQMYRDIPICTAAPTPDELALVRHHFVACRALDEAYSASRYENDVLDLLPRLWQERDVVVMCGGSMMYIDAVMHGIDDLPDIDVSLRREVLEQYEREGLESVLADLERLDPQYFHEVDRKNPRRVIHAVEICRQAGVPYSTLRTGVRRQRPWRTILTGIDMEREQLFDRINRRVDAMIAAGLEDEARRVFPMRHLNSLNTVGMKEMFDYFDGKMDFATAVARIKKNTRVYAKKQLTWAKRWGATISWHRPDELIEFLSPERLGLCREGFLKS